MRLQTKLVLTTALIIILAFQWMGMYAMQRIKAYYLDHFSHSLYTQAELLAYYVAPYVLDRESARSREDLLLSDIEHLVRNMTHLSNVTVQVLDQDGVILVTSPGDNHLVGLRNTEYEVQNALNGLYASRQMYRAGERLEVVAVPIRTDKVIGAVLLSASMEEVYGTIRGIMRIFVNGALIALSISALITLFVTRAMSEPLKKMTMQAEALAHGDYSVRLHMYEDDEIGRLGHALSALSIQLQEATLAQKREQDKLSSIITEMSEGVFATDAEGRIEVINPRALELLNWPKESNVIQRPAHEVLRLPAENEFVSWLDSAGSFVLEVPMSNLDHENNEITPNLTQEDQQPVRMVRVMTAPRKLSQKDYGTVVVLTDITQEKIWEKQQQSFVANVSHELKTPLSTFKSYLEAIEEEMSDEKPIVRRFLGTLHQETERMIRLVNDLLYLTRLDILPAPKRQVISVGRVLERALERFRVSFEQKGIQLTVEPIKDASCKVLSDIDLLERVIDNILSNALKYTPPGGFVTMRTAQRDAFIRISVEDSGIGIPPNEQKKVFERFYRVDKARSRALGGSGLGLAIAREIMMRLKGNIGLVSDGETGTTVWIELPVAKEMNDAQTH